MLHLATFGGLSLYLNETPITGVVTQRRQLAMLALLAVAGRAGVSRDKLVALLWPAKDADAGRHLLNQLLYTQRRFAGDAGLFVGKKTLRLNAELIQTDVAAFESAIAAQEREKIPTIYRGPFLDGFFLTEAAEFEAWVTTQRSRYARECADALETLAVAAAKSGNGGAAIGWHQRAQEIDPLNARVALALADAFVLSGDRTSALRTLRWHTERVRKELETEPDASVLALQERLARGGP